MSAHKCLLLLQRGVAVRQHTLSTRFRAGNSVLSGRWSFAEQRVWTSTTRTVCLQRPRQLLSAWKASQFSFCTKSGETSENEYPPLSSYASDLEPEQKVHMVQAKGLPWSCSEEDLLQFFSDCRIRGGAKGIHLTVNHQGKPSGVAFIEMEHGEDVDKALEMHRRYLGPRYVEVFEMTDSDAENVLRSDARTARNDGVVRFRGFTYDNTKEDIAQFLTGLDIVENGITIIEDFAGRNSGVAFVQFSSQEQANEALKRDREVIGNRYIEAFPSTLEEISFWFRQKHPARHPTSVPSANRSSRNSPLSPHCIRMSGLPFCVSGEDIVKFFSPLLLSSILIECRPNGRVSGQANVYFNCHEDAAAAMSRDKEYMGERYINLFLNSEPQSD
ncbi:G-rich sequence factor 1-like [Brachionichthys hirsutus]|uniref:G-rich sequence factor 1-like n=1 Tax=Brachionichthys hirsutus TaxID=412623 RepID=UPI0036044341